MKNRNIVKVIFQGARRNLHNIKGTWTEVRTHSQCLILINTSCQSDFKNLLSLRVQRPKNK